MNKAFVGKLNDVGGFRILHSMLMTFCTVMCSVSSTVYSHYMQYSLGLCTTLINHSAVCLAICHTKAYCLRPLTPPQHLSLIHI